MPNNNIDDDEENVDFSESDTEFTDDDAEGSETDASFEFDTEEDEDILSEEEQSQIEDEEEFNEDDEQNEETHGESQRRQTGKSLHDESSSHAVHAKPLPSTKPVPPHEIPLDITVEVGRIRMSIQKLMELQPGNMLELDIRPENGVDLVVNGQKIAKAELLLLGDNLGVRIIDIG
jgi:type III secretion system YscQ/HrcQ family protein